MQIVYNRLRRTSFIMAPIGTLKCFKGESMDGSYRQGSLARCKQICAGFIGCLSDDWMGKAPRGKKTGLRESGPSLSAGAFFGQWITANHGPAPLCLLILSTCAWYSSWGGSHFHGEISMPKKGKWYLGPIASKAGFEYKLLGQGACCWSWCSGLSDGWAGGFPLGESHSLVSIHSHLHREISSCNLSHGVPAVSLSFSSLRAAFSLGDVMLYTEKQDTHPSQMFSMPQISCTCVVSSMVKGYYVVRCHPAWELTFPNSLYVILIFDW